MTIQPHPHFSSLKKKRNFLSQKDSNEKPWEKIDSGLGPECSLKNFWGVSLACWG
jgi:hypothetical protein